MATSSHIADSLTVEEIPVKLRCASCNKLAQEAVRLPCCDQNICADCQANKLETTCPICYHEPIDAKDCRPNKALRQTIRVFLKKKAIDRDNAKKQQSIHKAAEAAAAAPPTPATPQAEELASVQLSQPAKEPAMDHSRDVGKEDNLTSTEASATQIITPALPQESTKDIPQQSIESPGPQTTPRRASTTTLDNEANSEKVDANNGTSEQQQQARMIQHNMANMMSQGVNGFGIDPSAMGFNNMEQMMQMMPNGMANPMMAGFPNMMGMSGMGMDPMSMQGMFNSFGGPGTMNGMSMGMGFDTGQGAFGGGFNGQQQGAWNSGGPNKFNQNAFGGGESLAVMAGYGAGYNMPPHQGNFNQMHQANYPQNDFHQRGYHNQGFRGRGRGRAGYPFNARGRGNHHQVYQNYAANSAPPSQQIPEGPVRRGSPVYNPMNGESGGDAYAQRKPAEPDRDEFAPGDAEDRAEEEATTALKEKDGTIDERADTDVNRGVSEPPKAEENHPSVQTEHSAEASNPTVHQQSLSDPTSPSKPQDSRLPTSSLASSTMAPPPSPSIPTGPSKESPTAASQKAAGMQDSERANDNTPAGPDQRRGLHGRGFTRIPNGEAAYPAAAAQPVKSFVPPVEPKGVGVMGAPTGPKAMRQGSQTASNKQDTGFSIVGRASAARANAVGKSESPNRSQSRAQSPSKHRSSRHHPRDRSATPSKESESVRRNEDYHSRSRKYEDEYDDDIDYRKSKSSRTRETTPENSSKRSHRSHRNRDFEKKKEQESERGGHRSHKYRDREAEDTSQKRIRHRSHSAVRDIKVNGASKSHRSSHHHRSHDPKEEGYPTSTSSGKRRSRDEHEEDIDATDYDRHRHHCSKRSKYASDSQVNGDRDVRNGDDKRSTKKSAALDERIAPPTGPSNRSIPTGPKAQPRPDQHALEREKRDRERQMKELQRRAIAGAGSSRRPSDSNNSSRRPSGVEKGGGGDSGIRINGAARRGGGRKISVRYEDELEDMRR